MTNREKNVLMQCGLFRGIERDEVQRLLVCLQAEEVHCEKNEILWHMGDPIHACALILSGSVKAETVTRSGDHALMAHHGPGALVGDVLMATPGGISPVYVTALEPTTLVYLPFQAIMSGCSRCCSCHTALRENLISEIAQKFWVQRRRCAYLSGKSLRQRICMYLLDRCPAPDTPFRLGLTREELSEYLGVNRSALSRELGRMREEGLLECRKDLFSLLNPEKLKEIIP